MGRRTNRKLKKKNEIKKRNKRIAARKYKSVSRKVNASIKYIRNLSDYTLNEAEITALGKGLTFVPTSLANITSIMKDFSNTERLMRLRYMSKDKNNATIPIFRRKSNLKPIYTESNKLEDYLYGTKLELANLTFKKQHNLSKSENTALRRLKGNDNIIIRKADKGNTIVILNRKDYIEEGFRQLNNGIHYTKIESVDVKQTQKIVQNQVAAMFNTSEIDKETFCYLYDPFTVPNTPYIYFLPKIHKISSLMSSMDPIKKDPNVEIKVPGRPIISQCGAATENIGRFLDYFLKPIVKKQSTYIKDTKEFINKIERIIVPESSLLITYDITSLYTNLRFKDILSALKIELDKNTDIQYSIRRPSSCSLVKIAEILLTSNEFHFDGQAYRQIIGAPQGAVPSPEICDIAIYHHIEEILGCFDSSNLISFHVRFRDDGFLIFNGSRKKAEELFEIANSCHELLKFTFEISDSKSVFLDTEVYKGYNHRTHGTLDIKCHVKPTETFQYLHRNSCHPPSVFRSFIVGEIHRYLRNTNNVSEYDNKLEDFKIRLIERGYKANEINKCMRKLQFNDRKDILKKQKHDKEKKQIVFSTKYNMHAKQIKRCVLKHWHLITSDPTLKALFPSKIMVAYKKGKRIGDIITRNKT